MRRAIYADVLLLLTDVTGVFAYCGRPTERLLRSVRVEELRTHPYPAGSMGPKVEAACRFVEATGRRAGIGSLDDVAGLLEGSTGTSVTK